jgi:hypothetical protein
VIISSDFLFFSFRNFISSGNYFLAKKKRSDLISHGDVAIREVLNLQFPYMESEDPDAINE